MKSVLRLAERVYVSRSDLVLALLILVGLVPLWAFSFFPTQDGPAHLENASILLKYWNPAYPQFRQFYLANFTEPTNWFSHLILAALLAVTAPPIAEKLFLTAYIILFPLAVRYALRAIHPQAGWLAIAAFPFVFSFVLYKGFYDFCASLPLYFFVLGFWLRRRERLTWTDIGVLTALSFLLYFAHLVSWVMGALGIGLLTLWFCARELYAKRASVGSLVIRRIAPLVIVFGGPAILILLFVSRGGVKPYSLDLQWAGSFWNLIRLTTLVSFDAREGWLAVVLALGLGTLAVYQIARKIRQRKIDEWDGLLLLLPSYVLVYLIAPSAFAGGSFVKQRLMLYPFLSLILWLGAQGYSIGLRRALQVGFAGVLVGLLLVRLGEQSALNAQLDDLNSLASQIHPNAVIMPLNFSDKGHKKDANSLSQIRVTLHGAGYLAADRAAIDLANYEAYTDYFPMRFRADKSPQKFATKLSSGAPRVKLDAYFQKTGVRVDYVLLLAQDQPFQTGLGPPASILTQLTSNYMPVADSPLGFTKLYRYMP